MQRMALRSPAALSPESWPLPLISEMTCNACMRCCKTSCSCAFTCYFCFLGACPGLCYDKLPEVLQRGQVGVHPAACLAVGKCYLVLKQHHGAGNMLRFPGASSDASLWGPGCSWGSQWREGVAIGSLFLGTLAYLWEPVPAWGSQQLGLAFFIICRSLGVK